MALTKASIKVLQESLSILSTNNSDTAVMRERFQEVDRYQQKTSDQTYDTRAGEAANNSGRKVLGNVEIGITKIQRESAQAFLAGTFLTGYPIFSATSTREHEAGAAMLTALTARDQDRFGWVSEINRCLEDVLNYNLCAAEVTWSKKYATSVTTDIQSPASPTKGKNINPEEQSRVTARPVPVVYAGNKIKRIDPYNIFLDPSVEPSKVTEHGTYAGYVELKDYIAVSNLYREWNPEGVVAMNKTEILSNKVSNSYTSYHYVPDLSNGVKVSSGRDWPTFWGTNTGFAKPVEASNKYEVTTLYRRLIPQEFHLETPDRMSAITPQVYKLVWINGLLAFVEKVVSGHEYLPISVGQWYPGQNDKKSFVESLKPLQDLASFTIRGTMESIRRGVNDRAIYDPTRISAKSLQTGADSKIPVLKNAFGGDLKSAYHQIPYRDELSPQLGSLLSTAFMLSERETGQNQSTQGNFIKGNKTVNEFQTIMSNSEARLQLGAVNLHGTFFRAIKEMIKINFFLYATTESLENPSNHTAVEVDPAVLRSVAPEYKMADGIMPTTKMANTDVFMQAFQVMVGVPELRLEYDVMGMLISVLRQQGFTDLDSYKLTEEQRAQVMEMMRQQAAAKQPPPQPTQGE